MTTDTDLNDAHIGLEVRCDKETGEENEWGNPELCDNILTYEDDFSGLVRKQGWEGRALRLVCDECGNSTLVCQVCHGGGWYKGESTGKLLACHVCNTREYWQQQRSVY
jgi:hypothetical protein